ncbi:MAG: Zn finger-containing GTPase- Activating Protein for ARF [Trizodia sp. TS-e1964]|nr:MAG: Zn finger-containing GTPase- Activating Protein for ARF [Trizodia sp. TS-e1964]
MESKASPKFGIFICLSCAGIHRGLGVHISFVRSITMDSFKTVEIQRMSLGGNNSWKKFFEDHEVTKSSGSSWAECTVAERYDGEVGEEWKDRLSAKAEGRDYVPGEKPKPAPKAAAPKAAGMKLGSAATSRSATPLGRQGADSSSSIRTSSPASSMRSSQKVQNESYFARMGAENASRPDDLPPNLGGKFTGFGSAPPEPARRADTSLPGLVDLQNDPVAALSRGFGWFTTTVGKGAKTVNDNLIQPTAQKIAEADLASTARQTAAQLGQTVQSGTRLAGESFNKFVEGNDRSTRGNYAPLDTEKKDFWDSFGGANDPPVQAKPSAIGTAAMRKTGKGEGPGKADDGWDDW